MQVISGGSFSVVGKKITKYANRDEWNKICDARLASEMLKWNNIKIYIEREREKETERYRCTYASVGTQAYTFYFYILTHVKNSSIPIAKSIVNV